METPALEILPDQEFRRVLCVVAHPDDVEYGTSAAVAEWAARGIEVAYLLLTSGEAGMQRPPAEVGPLRAAEQRAACAAVGVEQLTILNHPDGMLVYSLELRRDIARAIRQFRPDVVVTGSWEIEPGWGLNQADHRAAGLATLDAVRDADNTWVFPELAESEGLSKWGTTWLLVSGDSRPTHGVRVSPESVARAVASLEAHAAYLADLPWHPAPADFIPGILAEQGKPLGAGAGVLFRAHRLRD
ncbi:MAG: PIG-L family deacetylase [Propionibacteriaceae bacterium]|nr:PIG-L family deacetylase [Propionibacteriaceae bacterium]